MQNPVGKISAVLGTVVVALYLTASSAMAQTFDPAEVVGDGAESTVGSIGSVVVGLLPIIAPLVALFIGWRVALRLIRSNG